MGVTSVTEKNGKWSIFYFDDTPVTYGGKLTISLPVFGDMMRKRLTYRFSMRTGEMIHQIKNGKRFQFH